MTRDEVDRFMRAQLAAGQRDLFLCRVAGWRVTPKDLARRTGLSVVTVRGYLNGRTRRPQAETVRRIHDAIVAVALEN